MDAWWPGWGGVICEGRGAGGPAQTHHMALLLADLGAVHQGTRVVASIVSDKKTEAQRGTGWCPSRVELVVCTADCWKRFQVLPQKRKS